MKNVSGIKGKSASEAQQNRVTSTKVFLPFSYVTNSFFKRFVAVAELEQNTPSKPKRLTKPLRRQLKF